MTTNSRKKNVFGLAVAGLSALLLMGLVACNDSSTSSPKDPCKDNATLCTPRATLIDSGAVVYEENCAGCHGYEGEGSRCPQVANSSFLQNHRERVVSVVLRGNRDTLYVNGQCFGGGMPAWSDILTDFQIASVLTYLRGTMNDSIPTNCNASGECTYVARDSVAILADSIAVWEVKAVRDTLKPYPDDYAPAIECPVL